MVAHNWSGSGGIWTHDQRLMSPLLYHWATLPTRVIVSILGRSVNKILLTIASHPVYHFSLAGRLPCPTWDKEQWLPPCSLATTISDLCFISSSFPSNLVSLCVQYGIASLECRLLFGLPQSPGLISRLCHRHLNRYITFPKLITMPQSEEIDSLTVIPIISEHGWQSFPWS